jgi:predicted transcriptional regulator of viral defense system
MKIKFSSLASYIDELQINGQYTFTREEAMTKLNMVSLDAFRLAALRLIKKRRLLRLRNGFYVIVPTQYAKIGAPPANWFIDALMKFQQQPYYVGLLSAAALYGAAHQQPQVFQVVTTKPLREIVLGRFCIQFFTKKSITLTSHQAIKTPTGYMRASLPEVTGLDLIGYNRAAGHLSHVATVLTELQEIMDENRLSALLETGTVTSPNVQRLGYLLEQMEAKQALMLPLKEWAKKHNLHYVPLRPDAPYKKTDRNSEWKLYVNEKIEADI